jgi:hypothetical protein
MTTVCFGVYIVYVNDARYKKVPWVRTQYKASQNNIPIGYYVYIGIVVYPACVVNLQISVVDP